MRRYVIRGIIATKNAEAQKFFDQGLIPNFGFNHDEAVRSLRRAIELDPEAAMAYWGVAWALRPRYAYVSLTAGSDIFLEVDVERERGAYQAVQKAMAMRSRAPEHERRYIEALAHRQNGRSSLRVTLVFADPLQETLCGGLLQNRDCPRSQFRPPTKRPVGRQHDE